MKQIPSAWTGGEQISTHTKDRVPKFLADVSTQLGTGAKGLCTHSGYMTERNASKSLCSTSPNDMIVLKGS